MHENNKIISFESLIGNRKLNIKDYFPNPFYLFVSIMQECGLASSDEVLCGTDKREYDDIWMLYLTMEEVFIPYSIRFKLNGNRNANDGSDDKPINWDAIRSNESIRDFILKSKD